MITVTGTKTITNTVASVFAASTVLTSRVFLYVRNLDDSVAILINGRIVEPGEEIKLKLKASESVTIMGQSISRHELKEADVVIRPATAQRSATDFQSRHRAILEGEKAATAAMLEIRMRLASRH